MDEAAGLHALAVLVIDPGQHTAPIQRADVDRETNIAVTGSLDRTVRVWSLADGHLIRTIRVPQGPRKIGRIYAVAVDPDGKVIAAGGWTAPREQLENIYLFDLTIKGEMAGDAATGAMLNRIGDLPDAVCHLAFSHDGRRLAAALSGTNGIRIYSRDRGWEEVARDSEYAGDSFGAEFAPDGRLATTSFDGRLRLYDPEGSLETSVDAGNARPYSVAFDREGARIAVGFEDSTEVRLFDGKTLAPLAEQPDVAGIERGNLFQVTWSADGRTLYAGGRYREEIDGTWTVPAMAWPNRGAGVRGVLPAGSNTIMSLRALPDGDLLVAGADPWLGRLGPDGTPRWDPVVPVQMDPRRQREFLVSEDGMVVDFPYRYDGGQSARFDVAALKLTLDPADEDRLLPPDQQAIDIDWEGTDAPTLAGSPLLLDAHERSRSLAIQPDASRFVLGTDWFLRGFDSDRTALWRKRAPAEAWAVNISSDARLVIAAYGDGTIRWHRMEDGQEILALFPLMDGKNWVAWTPEGFYTATSGARRVLRWHRNCGWDAAAYAVPASDIPKTHRPNVIRYVLPELGTAGAVMRVGLEELENELKSSPLERFGQTRLAVAKATHSLNVPGPRLHVRAIGISDYGESARHLDLDFAAQDARDIADALTRSQKGLLYEDVHASVLVDGQATKQSIFEELSAMAISMEKGGGDDLGVFLFSGHGTMFGDNKFYLLPHGVDTESEAAIRATSLPATEFREEIAAVARHGSMIVLLDACRSGGALSPADQSLRAMMDAPSVTVLTSSSAGETSIERPEWQNGAFTEALLEALRRADYDKNTLISITDISRYLAKRVPELTGDRQHPELEFRGHDAPILAHWGPG
jgi:WD40 repeat protein